MEFDLGLAVREDSENPIYYVEYAHARICSLLRALETDGVTVPETADLGLLSGEAEKALIKQIASYGQVVLLARLKLADTTRAVLKNAMTLIGCSAPEKM